MSKAPAAITLTAEQRSLIRQFSGKDIAEVAVEQVGAGTGWVFPLGGENLWLLKPAAPNARRARHRRPKPHIDSRYARFRLSTGKSRIHGWGVFAAEPIPAGKDVIQYVGEIVNPQECYRRVRNAKETYAIQLDASRAIDGAVGGSGAEIINHSCDPNIRYRIVRDRVFCQSIRPIEPGQELTADYRFRGEAPKVQCRCGSPECRGTINAVSSNAANSG